MRRAIFLFAFAALFSAPASRGDDKPKTGLDALQGRWIVTRFERDTKVSGPEAIKDRILTVSGSEWIDKTGDKINGKGTLKVVGDATPSFQAIDALFNEGFLKDKTSFAIFKAEGDTMRACSSKPGDTRPVGFETAPNSGRMLVEYKRAAPEE